MASTKADAGLGPWAQSEADALDLVSARFLAFDGADARRVGAQRAWKGNVVADVRVTYQEMLDTATRLRNNKTEVDARLTDCKKIVEGLVSNGFVTRQASGKFDEVSTRFITSSKEAMETLETLSGWLDKAVESMRRMDQEMSDSLNQQ